MDTYTGQFRLCDDAGMVSDEQVEPGSPGTMFVPGLTYRGLLNNLRRHTGLKPYTGPAFRCTGSVHLAREHFECTNPIHTTEDEPSSLQRELQSLLNKHSRENGSDTADYILADYMMECLRAYEKAVRRRGRDMGVPHGVPNTVATRAAVKAGHDLTLHHVISTTDRRVVECVPQCPAYDPVVYEVPRRD